MPEPPGLGLGPPMCIGIPGGGKGMFPCPGGGNGIPAGGDPAEFGGGKGIPPGGGKPGIPFGAAGIGNGGTPRPPAV